MSISQQNQDLLILEQIHDLDRGLSGPAELGELWDAFGEEKVRTSAVALKHRALIDDDQSLGGGYHVTPAGRVVVETMRSNRADRGLRRQECRKALLKWLDDEGAHDPGSRLGRDHFDASLDLLPFSESESDAAAEYLSKHGLVRSISAAQARHILLWTTEKGRECLDSGLSVEAYAAQRNPLPPSQVIQVTGSHNVIAGAVGAGATASATVTKLDVAAVLLLARAVREIAHVLDLPDDLDTVLGEIEQEDDPSLMRRGLERLYLMLSEAGSGAVGGVLAAYMATQFGITPAG
jgi:hypothetical protein